MAGGPPGAAPLADPGGGGGALDQQLARLPAALQGLQDRAVGEAVTQAAGLVGDHVLDLHRGEGALVLVLDGGGAVLVPGAGCDVELRRAYTVAGWSLYADQAGSAVVDLRVGTFATFPPATSLCAAEGAVKPTLSGVAKNRDTVLTGWTTVLPAGTILRPVLESASTVTRLSLNLDLR